METEDLLNQFCAKNRICLLIEGALRRDIFSYRDFADFLAKNGKEKDRSASPTVLTLSSTYGLEPFEIPAVAYEEINIFFSEVKSVLSPWSNNFKTGKEFATVGSKLYDILPDNPKMNNKLISIHDLNQKEKKLLDEWIRHIYFDLMIYDIKSYSFNIPDKSIVVRKSNYFAIKKGNGYIPLRFLSGFTELRDPKINFTLSMYPRTTLLEIGQALSKTFNREIEIEDCLQDKPVCVFGSQYSNPEAILRSIAKLFNLAFSKQNNDYKINRKKIRRTNKMHEVYRNIFDAMPSPFINSVIYSVNAETEALKQRNHQLAKNFSNRNQNILNYSGIVSSFEINKVFPKNASSIYFSQLTPLTRAYFGLVYAMEFLTEVAPLIDRVPGYITQYDSLYIRLDALGSGKSLSLELPGPDGKLQYRTGIMLPPPGR